MAVPLGLKSCGGGLFALGVVACAEPAASSEPEPEPEPEAAEVVVTAAAGVRLCVQTELWARDEIERVTELVGLEPRFSLPVVLGARAVEERCTEADDLVVVIGCTVGEGAATEAYATPETFAHELVHALRRHQELRTSALFEEGFAELVDGSDAYPRVVTLDAEEVPEVRQPEVLAQIGSSSLPNGESYQVAGHFFGFLASEYGEEEVAAFMREGIDASAERALQRFAGYFGGTLEEEAEVWREAGVQSFGRGELCPEGGEQLPIDGVVRVTIDCDAPGTMGLLGEGERAWVRRCFELPAGRYAIELDAGMVRWDAALGSCAEGSSGLEVGAKEVNAGEAKTLDVAACTWALSFSAEEEAVAIAMTLTPE